MQESSNPCKQRRWVVFADTQTCMLPGKILQAQYAFKISMIHKALQFALRITFRCVLHRCETLDIRCWKLYFRHNRLASRDLDMFVFPVSFWKTQLHIPKDTEPG